MIADLDHRVPDLGRPDDTGAYETTGAELSAIADYRAAIEAGGAVREILPALMEQGRQAVRERFEAARLGGIEAGAALAGLQDFVITELFEQGFRDYPVPSPTSSQRITVVAIGGYGRGLLAPGSDVDVLFLTPYKQDGWIESVVETVLYGLWDLHLKVGQAVRTVDECVRLARDDMTIRTSLLETRLICGDAELFDEMRARLSEELFAKTATEFAKAKLDERRQRHERAGGSRYLLEPNIKEGKGALRDLHSLFWIAKYIYRVNRAGELVERGVFTVMEARRFAAAERFLWTVRFWLHYLSGRASEQLSFDKQIEIAERMGYVASEGQSPVERFMMRYFSVAKEVGDLTRIFCSALEAQHLAPKRRGGGFLSFLGGRQDDGPVRTEHGRILIEDASFIHENPREIIRVFETSARTGLTVHPTTLRLLRRNLSLIDSALQEDPEANALFMSMLCDSKDPEKYLRLMNETGVLGRFIPEFGEIVCMMQFNMYHHYTVDEHTIRAIGTLASLRNGDIAEEAPLCDEAGRRRRYQSARALPRGAVARYRQGARRGPLDPGRTDRRTGRTALRVSTERRSSASSGWSSITC